MQLNIIEREDSITQLQLVGRLDVDGIHKVDVQFHAATSEAPEGAIIDLTHLDYIASLGMGMLFGCARSLSSKGKKLVLLNPKGMVEKTLRSAKMDSVIPIVHSIEDAEGIVSDD